MRLAAPRQSPKINHPGAGNGLLRRVGEYVHRFTILSGYKIGEAGIGWRGNFENELFHTPIIGCVQRNLIACGRYKKSRLSAACLSLKTVSLVFHTGA
jgi:hypothetical protein